MEQSAHRPPERSGESSERLRSKIAAAMGFLAHPIETIDAMFKGGHGGEITAPGADGPSNCNQPFPLKSEIKPPK